MTVNLRPCVCCGLPTGRRVAVRDRKSGEECELDLCSRCLENDSRSWRLRWEPLTARPMSRSEAER